MKQHITPQQLDQLTDNGKERLREWWKPQDGDIYLDDFTTSIIECCEEEVGGSKKKGYENVLPLLSIGQMIEFLGDDWYMILFGGHCCQKRTDGRKDIDGEAFNIYEGELCDALWEACVEVLNIK